MEENTQPTGGIGEQPLTKRQRRLLRRQEERSAIVMRNRARRLRKWGGGVGILVIVMLGAWGATKISDVSSLADPLKSCINHTGVGMHIHSHLQILIDGEQRQIPADVGISRGCMRPLHMHDASGTIHIESRVVRIFTLGQFFEVWAQPFSREQILDRVVDENSEIAVGVNGQRVETYGETPLRDGDEIVIEYRPKGE